MAPEPADLRATVPRRRWRIAWLLGIGVLVSYFDRVNLSASHRFEQGPMGPLEVRFDIINAFDEVYQIRNGTGVGVFAPQFGPRRGFFFGITKDF